MLLSSLPARGLVLLVGSISVLSVLPQGSAAAAVQSAEGRTARPSAVVRSTVTHHRLKQRRLPAVGPVAPVRRKAVASPSTNPVTVAPAPSSSPVSRTPLPSTTLTPVATVIPPAPSPQPTVSLAPSPTASPTPAFAAAPTPTSPTSVPTVLASPSATVTAARRTLGATAFVGQGGTLTDAGRYAYVELNAWEGATAAALKAAHPGLKVLMYKDASSTRSYAVRGGVDDAILPTGVGYVAAQAGWFLTDTTGARMEWPWAGHWWMDLGNTGYQAAWLANVKAELAAGPFDGVVMDNVMASPEWYLNGRTIARYPTKDAYTAATDSFLAAVAPALRATGALVLGNISDASPGTWDRWVGLLSGGNHEHSFLWNNNARYGGGAWLDRIDEIERTQRAGRIHTATSSINSGDRATAAWVRASWLMAWDGGATGSAQFVELKDVQNPADPVVASDLGQPTGPRTAVAGAWRRDFTGGAALVNPSNSSVTVSLGRTLTDASGALVSSVTLAPLSGALLFG